MALQIILSTLLSILSLSGTTIAWTTLPIHPTTIKATALHNTDPQNPCWQDNYDSDDDCLSTIYSAHFIAEEWIKSMPCGKDADCLPETLTHPGTMGDGGVEKVDVMGYLKIRKAAPVGGDRLGGNNRGGGGAVGEKGKKAP